MEKDLEAKIASLREVLSFINGYLTGRTHLNKEDIAQIRDLVQVGLYGGGDLFISSD